MIEKAKLEKWYLDEIKSMQDIADVLGCSMNKVRYWMQKHKIPRRSISDAVYSKNNPEGDPFCMAEEPRSQEEERLFGLGIGFYWGEGTKSNVHSVRLGNTDPALLLQFIEFLVRICGIKKSDLKFGLQIFSDMDEGKALQFWIKCLDVPRSQFQKKIIVTQSGKLGTYRKKTKHGVVTLYYYNKKLRDLLCRQLEFLGSKQVVYKKYKR